MSSATAATHSGRAVSKWCGWWRSSSQLVPCDAMPTRFGSSAARSSSSHASCTARLHCVARLMRRKLQEAVQQMQGATDMASVGWACERRDTSLRRKLQLAVRRKVRPEKVWVAKRRKHVSSWGVIAACHEAALLLQRQRQLQHCGLGRRDA